MKVLTATIWAFLLVAVASGTKSFAIWDQVQDLMGISPSALFAQGHPHALRYALVWPIFLVADATWLSAAQAFDALCMLSLLLVFFLVSSLGRQIVGSNSAKADLVATVILVGLATLMNGRGILAFLGYALLLFSLVSAAGKRRPQWFVVLSIPAALVFCSVSSGVLAVGFLLLMSGTVLCILRGSEMRASNLQLLVLGSAGTAVAFTPFVIAAIGKNVDYFGGGFTGLWEMLDHGAGKFTAYVDPLALLLAMPGLGLGYLVLVWAARFFPITMVICGAAISIAAIGGLFGFTTLSVGIIPLLVLGRASLQPSRLFAQGTQEAPSESQPRILAPR